MASMTFSPLVPITRALLSTTTRVGWSTHPTRLDWVPNERGGVADKFQDLSISAADVEAGSGFCSRLEEERGHSFGSEDLAYASVGGDGDFLVG